MQSPLIDKYLAGAGTLRQAAAKMSPQQQRARPIAGKWSTLEVVCHVVDMDLVFADRMKRVLAEDDPVLANADENRWAAALAYHDRDLAEELALLDGTRRQMGRILGALPGEVLARSGRHSTSGVRTLGQLLTAVTEHLVHHAGMIEEKRRAMGLD